MKTNGWVVEGEDERPVAFFWERELAFQYAALCYYEGIEKSFRAREASFLYFLKQHKENYNVECRIDPEAGADAEQLNVCREQPQEL